MKKFLLLGLSLVLTLVAGSAFAGLWTGPQSVTRTASISNTANAWVQLAGSTLDCQTVEISNDQSTLQTNVSFAYSDTISAYYWVIKPNTTWQKNIIPSTSYGIYATVTATATNGNQIIRLITTK